MKKETKNTEKPKKTTAKAKKTAKTVKTKASTKKTEKSAKKDPTNAKARARAQAVKLENQSQRKSDFLEIFKNNMCIVASSCAHAGISRNTFYKWRREDAEFDAKCGDIEELQKDFAEASLLKQIKAGNITATIFYAKTKMKDRGYTEKVELEHHTEQTIDLSKLTDEELLQYNALVEKMSATD